jgi:hypothetical protein
MRATRAAGLEFGGPIRIGCNVWIDGGASSCPVSATNRNSNPSSIPSRTPPAVAIPVLLTRDVQAPIRVVYRGGKDVLGQTCQVGFEKRRSVTPLLDCGVLGVAAVRQNARRPGERFGDKAADTITTASPRDRRRLGR